MLSDTQAREVIGATAYGSDGEKIGKIGQLFIDDATGQPEFVTVNTGLFGTSESFVPVREATAQDGRVLVPYSKDKVKDAPSVDVDEGHLDESQERRLYEYYGLDYTAATGTEGRADYDATRTEGYDTSGPMTDDAMTRSEELRVGTSAEETGRARLRKYVTTETETQEVPVRKEHIEAEGDVDDTNRRF